MQKKVIPWRHAAPDADLELVFEDRAARLGKATGRLIVVASLVDKPTNLGGDRSSGTRLDSVGPANGLSSRRDRCGRPGVGTLHSASCCGW